MARRENGETGYEEIYNEIKALRIPVLTLNKNWHDLFFEGKSREIERLEKELNNALKTQGKVNTERIELNQLKQTLMKQILENMDAQENTKESKKVEKSKELIEEINDKLILLEDKGLDVPDEIREANINLLMAGMEELCTKSMKNEGEIEELEEMIKEARIELKKKILLREQKIEEKEAIDKFFNKTVGRHIRRKYEEYLKN